MGYGGTILIPRSPHGEDKLYTTIYLDSVRKMTNHHLRQGGDLNTETLFLSNTPQIKGNIEQNVSIMKDLLPQTFRESYFFSSKQVYINLQVDKLWT
jgi:hypothetical protein